MEGQSLDEFHDDKWMPIVFAKDMNSANVRVVQRRRSSGFADNAIQPIGNACVLSGTKLHGHIAAQALLSRFVDDPHAATPELPANRVARNRGEFRRSTWGGVRVRTGRAGCFFRESAAKHLAVFREAE